MIAVRIFKDVRSLSMFELGFNAQIKFVTGLGTIQVKHIKKYLNDISSDLDKCYYEIIIS